MWGRAEDPVKVVECGRAEDQVKGLEQERATDEVKERVREFFVGCSLEMFMKYGGFLMRSEYNAYNMRNLFLMIIPLVVNRAVGIMPV